MYHAEGYELKHYHKMVLTHTRLYLLHNLRPSELIWSSLMAKEVLSADMVEEIKMNATNTQQVAALLDLLPARGPSAFDAFCDTLLECDHVHVAEHLKTVEATDQFREEIKRHAGSDLTDNQVDKFVASFKKSTPAMQRFAERKFEVLLEEREDEINTRETEMEKLEVANTKLQLEVDQMKSFFASFTNVTRTIAEEVQQQVPCKHFFNEEIKQLQNLQKQLDKSKGNDHASDFYKNMELIVKYIEHHMDTIISATLKSKSKREKSCIRLDVGTDVSLIEKLQRLASSVSEFIDDIEQVPSLPSDLLRTELQKVHKHAQNMENDVTLVNKKFRDVLQNKKKVETEIFSLLHNLKETRRLEREIKEKKNHINDLSKAGQLIHRKARSHRRELEQIQLNLTQKKLQLADVQKALESQLNSADMRMHLLLRLLPDDACDTDSIITDSESGTNTPYTEDLRSLSGSIPRMKQNGETYTLKSPSPKPNILTPKATVVTTIEKQVGVKKGHETLENRISSSMTIVGKSSDAVIQKNKSDNSSSKVGQPYKSKVTIPKQKTAKPVVVTQKPQVEKVSHVISQGDSAQASTSEDKIASRGNQKTKDVDSSPAIESDSNHRKGSTKRQHESSSESDSQPSSADSASRPKWPQAEHQPAPETSSSQANQAKVVCREYEPAGEAQGEENRRNDAKEEVGPEPLKTNRIVTNHSHQNQFQYVLRSNHSRNSAMSSSKMPLGMSREEYFRYLQTSHNQQSPILVGGLNTPTVKEVPVSMQSMVFRQATVAPSRGNKNEDGKRDPRSPSNKCSMLREAFATKRVEPFLKLPNNGS